MISTKLLLLIVILIPIYTSELICFEQKCPNGKFLDSSCNCVCDLNCPDGIKMNEDTCECSCRNGCPEGFTLNKFNCQCDCFETECKRGLEFDYERCRCPPIECSNDDIICPPGKKFSYRLCDCECDYQQGCWGGYRRVDPETCKCICPNVTCPSDLRFDQTSCSCVRVTTTVSTTTTSTKSTTSTSKSSTTSSTTITSRIDDNHQTIPSEVIECEGVVCPEGAYLDYTCQCRCQNRCPENFELDEKACQCLCREQHCHDYYIFDFKSCNCICDEQSVCYDGSTFDYDNCGCLPSDDSTTVSSTNTTSPPSAHSCPQNFIYDEETCKCICGLDYQDLETCPYNYEWDQLKCECVCVHDEICKAGYEFNRTRCECSCIEKKCRPNFIFDFETCDCICGLTKETAKCEKGYVFNPTSCECIKDPNGPSGC